MGSVYNPLLYGTAQPLAADAPYWDLSVNKANLFSFSNQAAVTTGAGLSATVATCSLSNNNGSGKNLAVLQVSYIFSAAPAAATVVYLVGGTNATNVTHTTPGTIQNGVLGSSATPVGKIDTAATLPAAPKALFPIAGVQAASSLTAASQVVDLKGWLVIPPGGYVAFQALTAAVGFCGIVWMEV